MNMVAQDRILSFIRALPPSLDRTLLLEHGQEFEYKTRPRHIPSMQEYECFRNSARTAAKFPNLLYTEGFACFWRFGELVQHAWLTDTDGKVIDVTWSSTSDNWIRKVSKYILPSLNPDILTPAYFGIAFNTEYVLSRFQRAGPSVLFNQKNSQVRTEDMVRIKP